MYLNIICYRQVQVNVIISSSKMLIKNLHKWMAPEKISMFYMRLNHFWKVCNMCQYPLHDLDINGKKN
jgi:hypothetical protein